MALIHRRYYFIVLRFLWPRNIIHNITSVTSITSTYYSNINKHDTKYVYSPHCTKVFSVEPPSGREFLLHQSPFFVLDELLIIGKSLRRTTERAEEEY